MKLLKNLCVLVGIVSMVYYLILVSYAGTRNAFSAFWLMLGIAGVSAGLLLSQMLRRGYSLPPSVLKLLGGLIGLGILLFFVVEGFIVQASCAKAAPGAEYVIVLGAQVRGTRITKSLRYRLEAAVDYLRENPDAKAVVSGGQGSGEDISEAEAMRGYLTEHGIATERILLEDRSVNTVENIRFSHEIIKADAPAGSEPNVVIATNGFHLFRAQRIARKQGMSEVSGLAAKSDAVLIVSYYVREALAVIKDFMFGNL